MFLVTLWTCQFDFDFCGAQVDDAWIHDSSKEIGKYIAL